MTQPGPSTIGPLGPDTARRPEPHRQQRGDKCLLQRSPPLAVDKKTSMTVHVRARDTEGKRERGGERERERERERGREGGIEGERE